MTKHGYLLPTRGIIFESTPVEQSINTQSEILEMAKRAESAGFESLWVGDSVLAKPRLEPLTTLAAVAEATDSARLGTAVYLPSLRHPVHVAHQVATVDHLSEGRFCLGVGSGEGEAVALEHSQVDVSYERRSRILDESLDIITGLWNNESFSYDGEMFTIETAELSVTPVDPPPIYVASARFSPSDGFPKPIARRIERHAGGWLPIHTSPDEYRTGLDMVRDFVRKGGRDPDRIDAAYYQDIVIAESEATAIEKARRFLHKYYPMWGILSDEEIKQRGAFGPPEVVAAHIEAYEAAGVDTFVTRFVDRQQRKNLDRYAEILQ